MRDYSSGDWGFCLIWGLKASVFPRAIALALPNAILAFIIASFIEPNENQQDMTKQAVSLWSAFTSVLFFVLYFRSNVAYGRWWEGGTLLQQTRGEWFNAYSSLLAFSSTDPAKEEACEEYHHCLARLMSMLFASALQQVSTQGFVDGGRNRNFEIIDPDGIDPQSLEFLITAPDKVEVILQWIQRSTIINMGTGILPIPPPVMSRAFQEISRGIVNLQNARKIADFPFPYPYAQTSVVMLLIHWCYTPFITAALFDSRWLAAASSFVIIFFLWCVNYIALQLEYPFGDGDNDLPMHQMQHDWNQSIATLLAKRGHRPPKFTFNRAKHLGLPTANSNGEPMEASMVRHLASTFVPTPIDERAPSKEVDGAPKQEVIQEAARPKDPPKTPPEAPAASQKGKDTGPAPPNRDQQTSFPANGTVGDASKDSQSNGVRGQRGGTQATDQPPGSEQPATAAADVVVPPPSARDGGQQSPAAVNGGTIAQGGNSQQRDARARPPDDELTVGV